MHLLNAAPDIFKKKKKKTLDGYVAAFFKMWLKSYPKNAASPSENVAIRPGWRLKVCPVAAFC